MLFKKIVFSITMATLLSQNLCAEGQKQKNRNNEIDNTYDAESGWAMYFDEEKKETPTSETKSAHDEQILVSIKGKNPKNNVEALLMELLKESKKQTKLQTEIRDILKQEFAPEPKMVTRSDGTKCVENSSADCFVMPIIAEAKRVPVLANWMRDPSVENAKEYLKWQSELFNRAFDMGNSMQFAVTKYGVDAYPQSFQRSTFDSAGNIMSVIKEKRQEKLLRRLGDSINYEIYLGMNLDADIYALDNIGKTITTVPESKFTLIFKDEKSKKVINEVAKSFLAFSSAIANGNIKTKVDAKAFQTLGLHTTPTYFVNFAGNEKVGKFSMPIADGRLSSAEFITKTIQALEYKKVIGRDEMVDYKSWKDAGNFSSDYLEHFYGLKLDKEKVKEIYNGN